MGIEILQGMINHKDESELSSAKAWVSIFIIFAFTLLTIRIVQKTRRDAKVALESFYQDMSKYKDHECLKTRTLHVKGVLPHDRTGQGLEAHMNKILKKRSFGSQTPGKVTSLLIIPDFTKQLELEGKIQDLKDLKMLLSVQEPSCLDCVIPSKYRDPDTFDKTMDEYENQLMEETMKPFINSGHAFVCFDSVNSLNTILKYFRQTPQ